MGRQKSRRPWGLGRWCLLMLAALGVMLSSGCATVRPTPPAPVTITPPPALTERCTGPELPADPITVGDVMSFSVAQEAALVTCEARRAALVAIIEAHRSIVTPPPPPRARGLRGWLRLGASASRG